MYKKDHHREKSFLKYFFSTYIPPYISSIPTSEEVFKEIYLSGQTVWVEFRKALDRYSFSEQLKRKLLKLFEHCEELWESYLCVTTDDLQMGNQAFKAWIFTSEVKGRWNEIRSLARQVEQSAKAFI